MIATTRFEVGGFPVLVPVGEAARAERLLFRGGFTCPKLAHDGAIRRVLDVAPGWGAFAIWSAHRWPYAWIDAVKPGELFADNAPMGARVVESALPADGRYNVVHCGTDWAWFGLPDVVVVEGARGGELDSFVVDAICADYSLAFADFDGPLATLTFTKGTP